MGIKHFQQTFFSKHSNTFWETTQVISGSLTIFPTFGDNIHAFMFSSCDDLVGRTDFEVHLLQKSSGILSWIINGALMIHDNG